MRVITQLAYYIDPAAANNRGDGSIGSPFRDCEEISRRWGADSVLLGSAYHVYFVGTPPASDPLVLRARNISANTAIYVHATSTAGAGVGPVSFTSTAVDAINTATNMPTAITASGLSAGSSIQKRIRLTSGANSGAHAWGMKADAATKLRTSEFLTPASFTAAPFSNPVTAVSAPPTSGNTFVVEDLRVVGGVVIDVVQHASIVGSQPSVILDGLSTTVSGAKECCIHTNGCAISTVGTIHNHWLYGDNLVSMGDVGFKRIYGGTTYVGNLNIVGNAAIGNNRIDRFQLQGDAFITLDGYAGFNGELWRVGQVGAFDNTSTSAMPIYVISVVRLRTNSPTTVLWGSGNVAPFFSIDQRGILAVGTGTLTQPYSTSSTGHVSMHDNLSFPRTSVSAYHPDMGLTEPRLMSFTNIQAAISAGGFGYRVNDPMLGARIIPG